MKLRIPCLVVAAALCGCYQQETIPMNPTVTQRNAVVTEAPGIGAAQSIEIRLPVEADPQADPAAVPAKTNAPPSVSATSPAAATEAPVASAAVEAPPAEAEKPKEPQWQTLFDGKTLKNWKPTEFGGEGEVEVKDGQIVLNFGADMTGITWDGPELPKTNFELVVEAMRVDGNDFFAGLTFPCGDSFCSFIPGGWGGGVVGISSIDGLDASENATTTYQEFEKGRWYTLRVRVTQQKLEAWIDKKQVVDTVITDRRISTRGEVDLSKPLGISTWNTKGAIKSIKLRKLTPEEIAAAAQSAKEDGAGKKPDKGDDAKKGEAASKDEAAKP